MTVQVGDIYKHNQLKDVGDDFLTVRGFIESNS